MGILVEYSPIKIHCLATLCSSIWFLNNSSSTSLHHLSSTPPSLSHPSILYVGTLWSASFRSIVGSSNKHHLPEVIQLALFCSSKFLFDHLLLPHESTQNDFQWLAASSSSLHQLVDPSQSNCLLVSCLAPLCPLIGSCIGDHFTAPFYLLYPNQQHELRLALLCSSLRFFQNPQLTHPQLTHTQPTDQLHQLHNPLEVFRLALLCLIFQLFFHHLSLVLHINFKPIYKSPHQHQLRNPTHLLVGTCLLTSRWLVSCLAWRPFIESYPLSSTSLSISLFVYSVAPNTLYYQQEDRCFARCYYIQVFRYPQLTHKLHHPLEVLRLALFCSKFFINNFLHLQVSSLKAFQGPPHSSSNLHQLVDPCQSNCLLVSRLALLCLFIEFPPILLPLSFVNIFSSTTVWPFVLALFSILLPTINIFSTIVWPFVLALFSTDWPFCALLQQLSVTIPAAPCLDSSCPSTELLSLLHDPLFSPSLLLHLLSVNVHLDLLVVSCLFLLAGTCLAMLCPPIE